VLKVKIDEAAAFWGGIDVLSVMQVRFCGLEVRYWNPWYT
jgi:hypothetical protein